VNTALFWIVVAIVAGGQILLLRSAWLMRGERVELPPGVPRSDARADLGWTLATAALTLLLLVFAYQALP
jgi:hypothetical protein